MNGNVWEWCQDWSDGFEHYEMFSNAGMPSGTHRMRRGGCWSSTQENCGVMVYASSWPSEKNNRLGLRLVIGGEDNYPKICFSEEEELALTVGESKSVDIKYGWGKYSVKMPEGISCTISDEKLIVNAIRPTTGTIQLCNDYTGEEAELDVTVYGQESFAVNGVSFDMAYVSGGEFTMGTINGEVIYPDNLGDPHMVRLTPYYIGVTEVTQELWKAVMGDNPSYFSPANGFAENLQRPVETVSWEECQEFIARLNELTGRQFCLPTEAQWECAARGAKKGHGYTYAGSNNYNEVAWCKNNIPTQDDFYGTQMVATKAPNELGLYDMSGNVMEWVQDWYGVYSWDDVLNPRGPYEGTDRVIRSGCWLADAQYCKVVCREHDIPSNKNFVVGLRLALRTDD
jgi:formylglycine-generating enzyme required for sulfatase activity